MKTTSISKRSRRRSVRVPKYALSDLERVLLLIYNAAPVTARAEAGKVLFEGYSQSMEPSKSLRFNKAATHFQASSFDLTAIDDLLAGESLKKVRPSTRDRESAYEFELGLRALLDIAKSRVLH